MTSNKSEANFLGTVQVIGEREGGEEKGGEKRSEEKREKAKGRVMQSWTNRPLVEPVDRSKEPGPGAED